MEKEFAPYEPSSELKELGFDEPCLDFYDDNKELFYNHENKEKIHIGDSVKAPLYQQAFRFFREKYQIDSWIYPNLNGLYSVSIVRRGVGLGKVSEYQTYPEAELACLLNLIELVKSK
jgi:hypothetical protein